MNLSSLFSFFNSHTAQEKQLGLALLKITTGDRYGGLHDLLALVKSMLPAADQPHVDALVADLTAAGIEPGQKGARALPVPASPPQSPAQTPPVPPV